ncbi:MAG: hypothetical protein HQK61_01440 [Desulfamplus sp.]|nr:hypothetical protein [Desulfamplus sp.]
MQAVEFESKSYNGIIEIPAIHKEWYDRPVKVILLTDNKLKNSSKDTDKSGLIHFFNRFNADLTGYRFNRDEANER